MWQCHNQLTAFFVHISRHYCFPLIAVLFSFVSDTAGEHWRRNWLNVEKLPIADAEETEGMKKIFVSRCLVLSSCLLQQLWLMKARKGQKHLWPTYLPDPPQTTWWNYSTHLSSVYCQKQTRTFLLLCMQLVKLAGEMVIYLIHFLGVQVNGSTLLCNVSLGSLGCEMNHPRWSRTWISTAY